MKISKLAKRYGGLKLCVYYAFLQIVLVLIRRQRRPVEFKNLDITEYGKYPGPAPIALPILNGWRLAFLARLQNSLIGDLVLAPLFTRAMGINSIRYSVCSFPQTLFPFIPPPKEESGAKNNKHLKPMTELKKLNENSGWRPTTCADYVRLYREGKTTPSDVAENVIENIKAVNPALNAICDYDEEFIRAQAEASTLRYQENAQLGPLDGVPCVIKVKSCNTSVTVIKLIAVCMTRTRWMYRGYAPATVFPLCTNPQVRIQKW